MRNLLVVPAAGAGSRLGLDLPKALVPISGGRVVLDYVLDAATQCSTAIIVVSPKFSEHAEKWVPSFNGELQFVVQESPTGMFDAFLLTRQAWEQNDTVIVIWGDQVNVRSETVAAATSSHGGKDGRLVLPLVSRESPYVQYLFENEKLESIREEREGDRCDPVGLSDVGVFVLSAQNLGDLADEYVQVGKRSSVTGELNFLPFLTFLVSRGWEGQCLEVLDEVEAFGVNTHEELELARNNLKRRPA
jgi:bifunctional UDP-N-acetylglucosamine pyrophosphorylase/glucosamine-1-phosphate N-acetyltransferase